MLFTKQDLREMSLNYGVFDLIYHPYHMFRDLIDAEPIFLNTRTYNKEQSRKSKYKRRLTKTSFVAIRYAGEMFAYNIELMPIEITYEKEIYNDEIWYRFVIHGMTIDDSSMHASVSSKDEAHIKFLVKKSFDFLNEYTKMPNEKVFEEYWSQYNENFWFNYN